MKTSHLIFILLLSMIACKNKKKEEEVVVPKVTTEIKNGLPDNPNGLNGYLYCCKNTNSLYPTFNSTTQILYAVFSDPAKDLTTNFNHHLDNQQSINSNHRGNVSVNNVTISNTLLFPNNNGFSVSYFQSLYSTSSGSNIYPNFSTQGNGSFKPINVVVPRGFPTIEMSNKSYTVSKSAGFTVNFADWISNYDSVTVRFNSNSFPSSIKKTVAAGVGSISFNSSELSGVYTGSDQRIYFSAFNYSTKTIEDKVYLFELSSKTEFKANVNY